MVAGGPRGRSSSTLAAGEGLPVAPSASGGDDDESVWGSDWDSDLLYESDWESDCEKKPAVTTARKADEYDSENEVLRVKSMKSLTRDGSSGRAIPQRNVGRPRSRLAAEDVVELEEDDDDEDEDDPDTDTDTDLEDGAAPVLACHVCKLRNAKRKVQCSRCPIRFCGLCLQNRNGEQLEVEMQDGVKWVCPKCRAGCGPGCNSCCTCAPCRKTQGLAPAGKLLRKARQTGFGNVHDFLIHRQTGESRDKIAKRKEGRGWTKDGGAMSTCSPGESVPKLEPAQLWTSTDRVPANRDGVEFWTQKKGVAWTIPKAMGDIMKSNNNHAKPQDGKPGGSVLLFGDMRKAANLNENVLAALKSNSDEPEGPVGEQKKVLDQVLGRESQKPVHMKSSLRQIVDRLGSREDEDGQIKSEPQLGSIQQIRRNRKHRKMGRILELSDFRGRKSRTDTATKLSEEATPGFLPTVRMDYAHLDECSKEPTLAKQQSTPQPTVQSVPDGHHDRPLLQASIQLKRPITSLQALRKMGILAKRNHVDFASQGSPQLQGPPFAPSSQLEHLNQSLKQSSQMAAPSLPVPPFASWDSDSQAISLRHTEKRKRIEFRSCSKFQNSIPAVPSSDKLVSESKVWRGVTPRESEPRSGFAQFSERRSVMGFQLQRQSGTQSGFESFSHKETSIGFASFKGEKTAGLSALKT